jgi:hemoglobin-like flavoprotein
MRVGKKDVRITLEKAREFYPKLANNEKDVKIWFARTETHAKNKKKQQTLWCLCVASCILFNEEMKRRKARKDIIDQIAHQFLAYGRVETSK